MQIIKIGSRYTFYDESLQSFERLPVAVYSIEYSERAGFSLVDHPSIEIKEKTYGNHKEKVGKVLGSFQIFDRSLGVILSGDKGIGKSLFAKMLCEEAVAKGYPVILVDSNYKGLARFLESIDQEVVILFDEFDKAFRASREQDDQASLLTLFDGTAGGKKLFIITCNELYGLNEFIVNRPGRFHYHYRFDYPGPEEIREYLTDKIGDQRYEDICEVVSFSQKISLNYDCLRAIAFELNSGLTFSQAISDLNIMNVTSEEYNVTLRFETGETLHEFRLRTNLFDVDADFGWATLFNEAERSVVDVRFDKKKLVFNAAAGVVMIPSSGLTLDFSDYEDEEESKKYRNLQPAFLAFKRCGMKNLHYAV